MAKPENQRQAGLNGSAYSIWRPLSQLARLKMTANVSGEEFVLGLAGLSARSPGYSQPEPNKT